MTITFAGRIASNGLTGYGQETGNVAGLSVVADPAGVAGNVLLSYLHMDDALAGGSHRSEVSTSLIRAAVGSQAWYWFEMVPFALLGVLGGLLGALFIKLNTRIAEFRREAGPAETWRWWQRGVHRRSPCPPPQQSVEERPQQQVREALIAAQ